MEPNSLGLIAAETAFKAGSQYVAGSSESSAYKSQAKQYKRAATAARAAGTYDAYEERRRGRILQSNAKAAMASSGGVASDEGAIELLAGIGAEAEYNSLAALFESESKARDLKYKADLADYEAGRAKSSAIRQMIPTLFGGARDIYQRWPGASDDSDLYKKNLITNQRYGWNSGVG